MAAGIAIGWTTDTTEARALVRRLSGEQVIGSLRTAMRKSCRTVQAAVKASARGAIVNHRRMPVRYAHNRPARVYRPVWQDVRVKMRRPEAGAEIAGEVALKSDRKPGNRAYLARILNSGVPGARKTKGRGKVKKAMNRGTLRARPFFEAGVRAGLPRAEKQFATEAEHAMRRAAAKSV